MPGSADGDGLVCPAVQTGTDWCVRLSRRGWTGVSGLANRWVEGNHAWIDAASSRQRLPYAHLAVRWQILICPERRLPQGQAQCWASFQGRLAGPEVRGHRNVSGDREVNRGQGRGKDGDRNYQTDMQRTQRKPRREKETGNKKKNQVEAAGRAGGGGLRGRT